MRTAVFRALFLSHITFSSATEFAELLRFESASRVLSNAVPGQTADSYLPAVTQALQGSLIEHLDLRQAPAAPPAAPAAAPDPNTNANAAPPAAAPAAQANPNPNPNANGNAPAAAAAPAANPNANAPAPAAPANPNAPAPAAPANPNSNANAPAPVAPAAAPAAPANANPAAQPAAPVAPGAAPANPPAPANPGVAPAGVPPAAPPGAVPTHDPSVFVTVQWLETWINGKTRTWLPHTVTLHGEALNGVNPPPGKGEIGMGTLTGRTGVTKTIIKGAAQTLGTEWKMGAVAMGVGIAGLI